MITIDGNPVPMTLYKVLVSEITSNGIMSVYGEGHLWIEKGKWPDEGLYALYGDDRMQISFSKFKVPETSPEVSL